MLKQPLGTLEEVTDLRTVWPHEALDFTPWLAENLSLLSDVIGIDIALDERESSVGSFQVDIFAHETDTDRHIIIENQLEDTNHDHLGKLITYAAGKSAAIIIWIVKRARDEHKAAIEWLNSHIDDSVSFFLCEVKLYRIGNSNPAVKFELIESPNLWLKVAESPEMLSSGKQKHLSYWTDFIGYAFDGTKQFEKEFNRRSPCGDSWLNFFMGVGKAHISLSQSLTDSKVEVSIAVNDNDVYEFLYAQKDRIKPELGFDSLWSVPGNQKFGRVKVKKAVDFNNPNERSNSFVWLADTAVNMKKVFVPYICEFKSPDELVDESMFNPEK